MKKLKIAYLLPGLTISGGVGVVLQHANRLLRRGHEVTVASMNDATSADWFPGQQVPILAADRLPEDLDVLVATHWSTSYAVASMPARNKCYFVQSDETRFHEKNSNAFYLTHLSYQFNFHYLTEARWIQKWLSENFQKKAVLVPNGLDRDIFHAAKPLSPRSNRPRILLEGAIDAPYKGMKEAFEVVRDLDVEVWCVSAEGKPEPDWKCHRFFEQVPMHKMKEVYSSCDILLKLSRMEGFFGPPMEMMACGGVNVVGKVTGHDEYIVDGENALVVDPLDIQGARAAVQKLIDDERLREKLRNNGFKTASAWDWESSIDILERYYNDLTEGRYGVFSPTQEITNDVICRIQQPLPQSPAAPHERVLRRMGNNKLFIKFAEKLFYGYNKWKSLTCSR